MARIGDGFQEDRVAGGAADILRRAGAGAGDAARVEDALGGILDRIDAHLVTPLVTEVVGVEQPPVAVGERVRQRQLLLILDLRGRMPSFSSGPPTSRSPKPNSCRW